jgi:hypothetical protein
MRRFVPPTPAGSRCVFISDSEKRMLQGDRSYLKASLTRGILDMQNRLIKLYVVNLQAIGTQAAFIAGFSFLGSLPPPPIPCYFSFTSLFSSLSRYWVSYYAKNWFRLAWFILFI